MYLEEGKIEFFPFYSSSCSWSLTARSSLKGRARRYVSKAHRCNYDWNSLQSSIRAAGVQEFYCHGLFALITWSEVEINVKIHSVKANDWVDGGGRRTSRKPRCLFTAGWRCPAPDCRKLTGRRPALRHCTVIRTAPTLKEHNGPYKRPDCFDPENCSFPI